LRRRYSPSPRGGTVASARATLGWGTLTIVLIGLIVMARLGPDAATEPGLVTQVVTQKIMAATVLVVLWLESREAERASERAVPVLPNESMQQTGRA
jgi:hypothetical protein